MSEINPTKKELLLTYGWAIAIVVVVALALMYLGGQQPAQAEAITCGDYWNKSVTYYKSVDGVCDIERYQIGFDGEFDFQMRQLEVPVFCFPSDVPEHSYCGAFDGRACFNYVHVPCVMAKDGN